MHHTDSAYSCATKGWKSALLRPPTRAVYYLLSISIANCMPSGDLVRRDEHGIAALIRRFHSVFPVLLVLAVGAACPAQATPQPGEARQFILDGVERAIQILRSHHLPRPQIAQRLREELRRGFDVPEMARLILGTARRQATEQQMARYLREFEELVVQTYTSRVLAFGPRVKSDIRDIIKVVDTTPLGGDQLVVRSRINRSGAKWVKIDWRIRRRGKRLLITDVVILGISQIQLYRSEFASVMRRSGRGIEGLIEALRKKNEALRSK